jgi:acetyltransferase-like isoleucine patch superfamily enzyme
MHRGRISTASKVGAVPLSRRGLSIGPGVEIDRTARIEVARGGRVILGRGVVIGPDARISAHGGTVKVGAGARLCERAVIEAHTGVEIGEGAVIGDWAAIEDATPTFADVERPINTQPKFAALVRVGARAKIGMHAVVGAGTTIPAGATVEAYAVVRDATSRS